MARCTVTERLQESQPEELAHLPDKLCTEREGLEHRDAKSPGGKHKYARSSSNGAADKHCDAQDIHCHSCAGVWAWQTQLLGRVEAFIACCAPGRVNTIALAAHHSIASDVPAQASNKGRLWARHHTLNRLRGRPISRLWPAIQESTSQNQ